MPDNDNAALVACEATFESSTEWEKIGDEPSRRVRKDKDWGALRELARKRAYVRLTLHHDDPANDQRFYNVEYRRFCYRDYPRTHKAIFQIGETPTGFSFRFRTNADGKWSTPSHYAVSFRGGRVAFYSRARGVCHRTRPCNLNLFKPLGDSVNLSYPEVHASFNRRIARMLRAKARANGTTLPRGSDDDVRNLLMRAMYPAVATVTQQTKLLSDTAWTPQFNDHDGWLLRHMRCDGADLPKAMTGYQSKAVKRLFWEALKPYDHVANAPQAKRPWKSQWCWLALLRTWLPTDHSQQILRAVKIAGWDSSFTKDPGKVRRFLKQWEPRRVLQMLTDTCADGHTIRDTIRMLDELTAVGLVIDRRFRDAHEMHEWLVGRRNAHQNLAYEAARRQRLAEMTPEDRAAEEARDAARKAKDDEPLPVKYGEKVDGKQVTTPDGRVHTIFTFKTGTEMNLAGQCMHNCIGSYAYHVRIGTSQLFGVRTEALPDEEQRFCHYGIEITDRSIRQFRGLQNVDAPVDLGVAVHVLLRGADLVDTADDKDALTLAVHAVQAAA